MIGRSFLFSILLVVTAHSAPEYKWEKIEGCTLVSEKWKDGDSFVVRVAPRTFRLYFVDTPEDPTDQRFPEWIAAQAAYFGISSEHVAKVGDEASDFTAKTLSAEPFTVYTLWQMQWPPVRGRGTTPTW